MPFFIAIAFSSLPLSLNERMILFGNKRSFTVPRLLKKYFTLIFGLVTAGELGVHSTMAKSSLSILVKKLQLAMNKYTTKYTVAFLCFYDNGIALQSQNKAITNNRG